MSRVLEIPLLEADSFLTIDISTDLPEDPSEICQLLVEEECATKWWLAIAAGYARHGNPTASQRVAETGMAESRLARTEAQKAPFRVFLSWLHIAQIRNTSLAQKRDVQTLALNLSSQAISAAEKSANLPEKTLIPAVLAQAVAVAAVGNLDDSLPPLQTVLSTQPLNVFAKMGRARVLFGRQNYRAALRLYQECLRQLHQSDLPFDPRLGIGLCFWHLGDKLKAKLAWERVVQRYEAHTGLAVAAAKAYAMLGAWFLDSSLNGARADFEVSYRAAIHHFQRAYQLGEIALPALKIASYLFSRHDMVRVGKLTDKVMERATTPELLAEAMFWKARAAHYANDLPTALFLYTQAYNADDQNAAALLGKGITELALQQNAEAMLTFELAVKKFAKNSDALFYAGVFAARRDAETGDTPAPLIAPDSVLSSPTKLLQAYLTACKTGGRSPRWEALVLLANRLERTNPLEAYTHLESAVTQLQTSGQTVPPELLINLSSLAFGLLKYAEAEQRLNAVPPDTPYATLVQYNLARVQESLGQDVCRQYAQIGTADAQARLFLLSLTDLELDFAKKMAEILALSNAHPQNRELRALHAWFLRHVIASAHTPAEREQAKLAADRETEIVKHTLANVDKRDAYSLVAMGNIYLSNAQLQPKQEIQRKQRSYMRAGEFYEKALQLDAHNAYAAMGVAVALAETRRADTAVTLLDRVRESLRTTSVQACINAGHALMEVAEFGRAAERYAQSLDLLASNGTYERCAVRVSDILNWLTRAWLARGSRHKDVEALQKAAECGLQALDAASADNRESLAFNLAYVRLQLIGVLTKRAPEQRSWSLLLSVEPWIDSAIEQLKQSASLPFTEDDLEEKIDHAENVLRPQLVQAISAQREHESRNEAKRAEAKRLRDEERAKRLAAEQAQRAEQQARDAQLAAERARLQQEAAEWEAERAREREQAQMANSDEPRKKRRRRQDDELIDDSEVPALPSDNESDNEPEVERKQRVMDDSDDYDEAEAKNDGEPSKESSNDGPNDKNVTDPNTTRENAGEDGLVSDVSRKQKVMDDSDDDLF